MITKKHSHHAAANIAGGFSSSSHARGKEGKPVERMEIVLKCDSPGSIEAVMSVVSKLKVPGVVMEVIDSSVGEVSKSDLLMALTGSKLVVGFNVGVMPKLDQWMHDQGVEVRTYNVIYTLAEDLEKLARSLVLPEEEEKITGKAKVIALFKSSHGGIILGCVVKEGVIAVGRDFRVITAMGPVYTGKVESLEIERKPIKEGKVGQQIGLKVSDFHGAKVGDLVECFEKASRQRSSSWEPSGSVIHLDV